MTEAFADIVMPVFLEVIKLLKEDLPEHGGGPSFGSVKTKVRGSIDAAEKSAQVDKALAEKFELAKFGLVAWIDEVLADSPWGGEIGWAKPLVEFGQPDFHETRSTGQSRNQQALEWDIYKSNDRREQFYIQAKTASKTRDSTDPLEVYLLCVALGFRGKFKSDPTGLQAWISSAHAKVDNAHSLDRTPFSDEKAVQVGGLDPFRGADLLFRASCAAAFTAGVTLVGYLLSVHASLDTPGSN